MSSLKEIILKMVHTFFRWHNPYKDLDPGKIKIGEKSYKYILIYHIGNVGVKNLGYAKINSVNRLHLIIDKTNGYIEESNRNKYLTLFPTDGSKKILKNVKNRD